MTHISVLIGSVLVCASFLAGCANPTLIVVPHASRCGDKPDDAKIASFECAPPKPVPAGATYQTIVDIARDDRQALKECGINMQALRNKVNGCNQAVDKFNSEIDKINAANKQR